MESVNANFSPYNYENEPQHQFSYLVDHDAFSKKYPQKEEYVVVETGVYELLKKNTACYVSIIQTLQGVSESFSTSDLTFVTMPQCGSMYLKELPNIVYNKKVFTGERA